METWDYGNDKMALYSEDPAVWEAARRAGLKPVATYYRRDGTLFARHFVGNKEKVQVLVRGKVCSCGRFFIPTGKNQKRCDLCVKR